MVNSYLALGYECNHRCICCPLSTINKLQAPFTLDALKEQMENIFSEDKEAVNVTVSGGEPTLHKNFFDMIRLLQEKNAYITVLSNASSCENKEFVKRLVECLDDRPHAFEYVTAIHSMDAKLHDQITGVDGSLVQTLRGLDNLQEAGIKISIKHIMSGMSCKTMKSTIESLHRHFSPAVAFYFCAMDYAGNGAKNADRLFATFRDIQPYLEDTLDLWCNGQMGDRKVKVFETPLCAVDPYYWKFFTRTNKGTEKYLAPGTNHNQVAELVSDCTATYKECENCDVCSFCEGVWSSAYHIGKEIPGFLEPIKAL